MIRFLDEELIDLSTVYLVSNTPRYLYKQLRIHPTVQRMGEKHTLDEIILVHTNSLNKKDKTAADIALAYASLVAMRFKERDAVAPMLANIHVDELEWGQEIIDILKKTEWDTKILTLDMPKPEHEFYNNMPSQLSVTIETMQTGPRIEIVGR